VLKSFLRRDRSAEILTKEGGKRTFAEIISGARVVGISVKNLLELQSRLKKKIKGSEGMSSMGGSFNEMKEVVRGLLSHC